MPVLAVLCGVVLEALSPASAACYELPVFEEVVVVEHLLDFVHFLLIADAGGLECRPESLPFGLVH